MSQVNQIPKGQHAAHIAFSKIMLIAKNYRTYLHLAPLKMQTQKGYVAAAMRRQHNPFEFWCKV